LDEMKVTYLILFIILIIVGGCGDKRPYQKFSFIDLRSKHLLPQNDVLLFAETEEDMDKDINIACLCFDGDSTCIFIRIDNNYVKLRGDSITPGIENGRRNIAFSNGIYKLTVHCPHERISATSDSLFSIQFINNGKKFTETVYSTGTD
jgi:hypothetical protein